MSAAVHEPLQFMIWNAFEDMENFTKGVLPLFYYAGVLSAKLQEMPHVRSCRQKVLAVKKRSETQQTSLPRLWSV